MADSLTNNLGTFIIAAGTTVLSDQAGNLVRAILPGTYVGSVEFYDSRTTAGTAAGNQIYNIGLPLTNLYRNIEMDFPFKRGLVSVATGTPTVGVVWNK